MKTVGRLSKGIRLGYASGFDSGRSLDYIYANKSRGITPLGRLIDRAYLSAIGWRGIRQRKLNMDFCLDQAIEALHGEGRQIHILDIAAGVGRYLLEAAMRHRDKGITLLLRDNTQANLDAGRQLAMDLGCDGAKFELGDAFSRESIEQVAPQPNVAVVSGLYELFADNTMVLNSLKAVASILPDGGYLIYTSQPWHPQVEMIARTLPNRDGKPWIMRRRCQAEMDELVSEAGLEKIDTRIGPFGIFNVSIARKLT